MPTCCSGLDNRLLPNMPEYLKPYSVPLPSDSCSGCQGSGFAESIPIPEITVDVLNSKTFVVSALTRQNFA